MGIVSLSIPKSLLEEIEKYTRNHGFANRSEIVRQALRAYISEGKRLGEIQGEITATITTIYHKGARTGQITDIQHSYSDIVLTFLHTHVEKGYCIEIIVAKGDAQIMKEFISALKANRHVSEVKVTLL
ncbi:TPA: ribbon-helix-helix protein, CopG family [Candidatus Bathyarchaeota archaeon]|nr:ribbon-helix-helix protein, CopG family [Candidatus Bathyarchaeota archaeon]